MLIKLIKRTRFSIRKWNEKQLKLHTLQQLVHEYVLSEEVAEAVRNKKIKFGKWKKENTEEARMEYKKSRENAKRVISSAKAKKQKEWANDLNDSECQNEIFCCCCIFTCDKLGDTNNRLCNYSSRILHQ